MADYKEVKQFLVENSVTDEQMDMMWSAMYSKNAIVKNLTDHNQTWSDLNKICRQSLIRIYNEDLQK